MEKKKTLVLVVLYPTSRHPHVRTPETNLTHNCYYSITLSQPFAQRGQYLHHLLETEHAIQPSRRIKANFNP